MAAVDIGTRIAVRDPIILVLADGATDAARNEKRGKLFEEFVALLLEKYGYEKPTRERLNVTSSGIELDVTARHRADNTDATAECKAYSTPVPAGELDKFYGKLGRLRLKNHEFFGWFFALPRLTSEGHEEARTIAADDPRFRLMTAENVLAALREFSLFAETPSDMPLHSDIAVVITEHGLAFAAKLLDDQTRLPIAIAVWQREGVPPDPVLELLTATTYASGSSVTRWPTSISSTAQSQEEPTVLEVVGSTSDFEYQLPASPEFFVGRAALLQSLRKLSTSKPSRGQTVVVNAQSGWGKSSLALRIAQDIAAAGGVSTVLDTRTAATPEYVWAAVRRAALVAVDAGLLSLPADASFGSLASCLATLESSAWAAPSRPLLIFFDQFENVFRDQRITSEFRNLALAIPDLNAPVVVAFAWKTDLVTLSETHPFQLIDDIRDRAFHVVVPPLGAKDIETLLSRLEVAIAAPLLPELEQRLREYSQGLPWLFKKLASHVHRELEGGATQEALLTEALNVRALFETDLAELRPEEQEALKTLARIAPVLVSEAVELVPREAIQSLLNRRLLVAVGEHLDTYWDIFRDFLVSGSVPVRETYILRQSPGSVARLLLELVASGGSLNVADAATRLRTTDRAVYNMARELRLLGVIVATPGRLALAPEIADAENKESAIREKVATALRRHSVYYRATDAADLEGALSLRELSLLLPAVFPAVEAKRQTWQSYARAFAAWVRYAGLARIESETVYLGQSEEAPELLGSWRPPRKTRQSFPQSLPSKALQLAEFFVGRRQSFDGTSAELGRAVTDLIALGAAGVDPETTAVTGRIALYDREGNLLADVLLDRLRTVPGGAEALDLLRRDPGAPPLVVGACLRAAQHTEWATSTTTWEGKAFRAWARAAGIRTTRRRTTGTSHDDQLVLADE
jgi:hypothetical protein